MENNLGRTPKRPASAINKNRLMLGDTKRVTEPFMFKIKPYGVPQDKEKMYEEINKLRLLNNCLKEELTQHKARIRQHLQDLNSRDDLIMQLTGKFDKAGYERVHLVAELSKANRQLQMQLDYNISELEDIKKTKPTRKMVDLVEENKNKSEIIQKLMDENKSLNEEKADLHREVYDLKEKVRELEENIKGMVLKNEHDLKISDFNKKLWEKDNEINKLKEERSKILNDLDVYKARCAEHEKKNDKLVEQIKLAEKMINELKTQIKNMTDNEDKLKRELAERQKDLSGKVPKSELDKLHAMINEYEKNEKKYKDSIEDLKKKLNELHEQFKDSEKKLKDSEEYNKNLIQDLNKQIKDLKENKDKSVAYPFTLPRHFQYLFICLQIARIKPKELKDNIFVNLGDDLLVSKDSLISCFNFLSFKIEIDKNILSLLVDDIMKIQDKITPKSVTNFLLNVLGQYEVLDKNDEDKYEKHLLRLLAMNYNELFQKCRSFDINSKGILTINEFYPSDKPVWIYLLILLYTRDRQFDYIYYESFLCDFLQNIEKLNKDDEKSIAICYFEKIAEIGINQKITLSKVFYKNNKIISPGEFKKSCLDIKLYLEIPLIVIMMKHYGTTKDNNYGLKKSQFLDVLKKFKYTEDDSSHSSSESKSSDSKFKSSALPMSKIITESVDKKISESIEKQSFDKSNSSSSKNSKVAYIQNKPKIDDNSDKLSKGIKNKEEKKISDHCNSSRSRSNSSSSSNKGSGNSKDLQQKVGFPSLDKLKDSADFQDSHSKSSKRLSSDLKAKIPKKDLSSNKNNLSDSSHSYSNKKKFKMPNFEEKKSIPEKQDKQDDKKLSKSSNTSKSSSSKEESSKKSKQATGEAAKIKFNIPQLNDIKMPELFKSSNPSLPESSRYNKEIEFDKTITKVVEVPNPVSKKSTPSNSSSSSKSESYSETSKESKKSSESSSKNIPSQPPVFMPPPVPGPFQPNPIISPPPVPGSFQHPPIISLPPVPGSHQPPPINSPPKTTPILSSNLNQLPVSLPSLKATSKSESSDQYSSEEGDSVSDDKNSNQSDKNEPSDQDSSEEGDSVSDHKNSNQSDKNKSSDQDSSEEGDSVSDDSNSDQSDSEEYSNDSHSDKSSNKGSKKKLSSKSSSNSDVTPSASGSSEANSSNPSDSESFSSQSSSSKRKAKNAKNAKKKK